MGYTDEYRKQILQKILGPNGPGVRETSNETGVNVATLYRWLREANTGQMSKKSRTPRNWSNQEKYAAIKEAAVLPDAELGKWLRAQGLHTDQLKQWEKEIVTSLGTSATSNDKELKRELKELKKEIRQKDKALAELSALLILKKKPLSFLDAREDFP